ncbi:MAG: ral stress protein [Bacteroidetes bacterium]|jgi:bacillithiol system protein YtxJ|nr:ral stress protein [Bacteroidota bacterium]MDF2452028.1 ral stress protein [Bacteroidota bacterium]
MLWHKLSDINQLKDIKNSTIEQSGNGLTVLLFKHSTRCSISSMALNRLESKWQDQEKIPAYYLDLLSHRDISNEIASLFDVEHASPQVLLIKNGVCIYHNSHSGISASEILEAANN